MRTLLDGRPAASHSVAPGIHVAVARAGETAAGGHDPAAARAAQSLAARALLRGLLAQVAGPAAAALPVAATDNGRPYLPDRPDLGVSLSHDGGWVAVAVGLDAAVGVDVQLPVPVTPALIRRCCTPDAARVLDALPTVDRDLAFAWIWTVQEACVKAEGTGLAGRPWTVPVPVDGHHGTWRGYRWHSLRDRAGPPLSCAHRPLQDTASAERSTSERENR
ncbi:4'-phosphopantetheinyl transferase family protein [Dactylosporangium matsuzakiense]|uniref:4'-phosphopantetheinyl transferase domain-containing protein n=1 Tax=Dactylosporangium matsuzakiense TaxID=53360 RepID=A0A9W6KSK6_9ACTN|nr:4'-phosphopantetheinyl transferase superfamily protein [Dactylosporangium matsuzakiense]UWZ42819.1 4'-phosphopantetheinyl transferase superfamily protein [Dactylosporangium matsuzakiense]GLL04749.1 hypothetical protein GCM10017581_064960 [Dactylosporangium matsuzakiense]